METAVQGLSVRQDGASTVWSKAGSSMTFVVEGDNTAGRMRFGGQWHTYRADQDHIVVSTEAGAEVARFDASDLGWDQFAASKL